MMKIQGSVSYTEIQGPLGHMTLAATTHGLVGIWFEQQKHSPDMTSWDRDDANPTLLAAKEQLDEYFSGRRSDFDLSLDLRHGTDFQQSVWKALLSIPCGKTTSYGALSAQCGRANAVRAVGGAIGRNPFSIVVPCHRVLGSSGALTGYAGGVERKVALLKLEGAL
jgi:methylated-DNA-[protein]-cysteine S-methyltransferase